MFFQSCNLSELALGGDSNHLMSSPQTYAHCLVTTRINQSKFIDMPSGLLSVVLKRIHTTKKLPQTSYVKI